VVGTRAYPGDELGSGGTGASGIRRAVSVLPSHAHPDSSSLPMFWLLARSTEGEEATSQRGQHHINKLKRRPTRTHRDPQSKHSPQ